MLTVPEVAARMRVTTRTVRYWIMSGKIRAVRIGRPWVIDPESFQEALKQSPHKEATGQEANTKN